ncbi:MAG: aspartate-semialdehyde dehydrogenase [Gammaproteobacteria bacterium]
MPSKYNVAVVGVTSVVGEALLSLLAERNFPIETLHALDCAEAELDRVEFRDGYVPVRDVGDFDFAQTQLAFFCAGEELAARHVPRAAEAGCIVIDDSTQFRGKEGVPLVAPEVNAHAIAHYRRRIIANPNSCTTMLLVALKGIYDAAGIERLDVATYQAVSGMGKAAMDELAAQTVSIFNMKEVVSRVYPKQIAFNVLPVIGECLDNGYTREEMKIVEETRKILDDERIQINASCVQVPVFFGHSQAVHIETREKVTATTARQLLGNSPGVKLVDDCAAGAFPTAVTEAVGTDAVYVGRVRDDLSRPRGLDLWITADNVRRGAALNCIQIAEILVKDYLG